MPKCFEDDGTTTFFKTEFKNTVEALILEIKNGLAMNSGPYGISLMDSIIFSISDENKNVVVS